MTITPTCFIEATMVPNSDTLLYTVPAASTVIIDKFTATNTDGVTRTLNVNLIASGGAAGTSNLIMDATSIATLVTRDFTELQNQILATGDQISCNASAASVVNVRVSGRLITS